MINDLDETVKKLLVTKGDFEPAQVDIKFELPDREWSASISKPTINLYLYDIRENHQLRGHDWIVTRDQNGIATKKKNPIRVDVSYLITVWANDVGDEHRILWNVMATLFRYPEIPDEVLSGGLVDHPCPIKTLTAQPDGLFHNPSDFWAALDNNIKASINYVVTLPLDSDFVFTAPIVKTKTIDIKPPNTEAEKIVQIAGTIRRTGKSDQVISEAKIFAKEAEMTALVDDKGNYTFPNIRTGKHTFQVVVGGKSVKDITFTIPGDKYDIEI
ncbi:MAG: hypothetical protein A2Z74_00590 [Chloroflexi bacterium RBG_13_46_9]|nr:MAG: hypothetical protein A2Z74_00590 [Chloroflexi bacterium RBG_13_46_9]